MIDKLTQSIYQGDLDSFIELIGNRRLKDAYYSQSGEYNMKVGKAFGDITRRIHNRYYLETVLCDLYGVMTDYERLEMMAVGPIGDDWYREDFRDLF